MTCGSCSRERKSRDCGTTIAYPDEKTVSHVWLFLFPDSVCFFMAVEKDVVHSDDVNVDPGSARRSEKGLLARDELVRNESKRPDVFGKRGERVVA